MVKSLVDKETGRELVDSSSEWGLGQCFYETMPDIKDREFKRDAFKRTSLTNVAVRGGDNGPVWKSLSCQAIWMDVLKRNPLKWKSAFMKRKNELNSYILSGITCDCS